MQAASCMAPGCQFARGPYCLCSQCFRSMASGADVATADATQRLSKLVYQDASTEESIMRVIVEQNFEQAIVLLAVAEGVDRNVQVTAHARRRLRVPALTTGCCAPVFVALLLLPGGH